MDISASDDPRKRKLPMWMLGVSAADKASKSLDVEIPDAVPKRKRKTAVSEKEARRLSEEALDVGASSVLVKCRMRRKRGGSRGDGSSDDEAKEIPMGKKRRGGVERKIEVHVPLKRKKAKSFEEESDDDIEVSSPGENNGDDLTMEDLMSFAKEYVEDDNDKGQQQPSGRASNTIRESTDDALFRSENEVNAPGDEGLEAEESKLIMKHGTKGRKKETSRSKLNRDSKSNVRNKAVKPVRSKQKTSKSSGFNNNDDIDVWSPHDDDDLTMEDLMSIATEVVEDNKDDRQKQLDGVPRTENQPIDTAFHRSETMDSTIDPQILKRTLTHEKAISLHSSTGKVTSTIVRDKPIMTGDSTQDMLSLLLGPLYMKSARVEKKMDLVSHDDTLSREFKEQNENLVIHKAPALAPLAKKKSSLKDKVAMFLD